MSHTPTPYRAGGKCAYKSVLLNARGESIASGGNNRAVVAQELEDTLEFIARACNSHDDLVAALELISKRCGPFAEVLPALDYASIGNIARAALAKARGEA